jgi:hypothetical protein
MTDNHFHLAAALLADAADLLTTAPLGTTVLDDHSYGQLPLAATHTVDHDATHTLTLWAADDDGLLAAVEARLDIQAATPTTRIVAFRAADLVFTAHDDWTFTAASAHTYSLAARVGDDRWDLAIDGHPFAHLSTIDVALDILSRHHHDTRAR